MNITKEILDEKRKIVISQKDMLSGQAFKLKKDLDKVTSDIDACIGALQILDILEKDLNT